MATFINNIAGTDCIGDSRTVINGNFEALDTKVVELSTQKIQQLIAGPGIAISGTTAVTISAIQGSSVPAVATLTYNSGDTVLDLTTVENYSVIRLVNNHSGTITFSSLYVSGACPVGKVFTLINASTITRSFAFSTNINDRSGTIAKGQACSLVVTSSNSTNSTGAVW